MTSALSIKQLTKTYENGFEALKGIDFEVKQGDFFALLGPNGAGKSTTIGVLSSLVRKSTGSVSIMGVDIDDDFAKAKQFLGVVPQEFNFNVFEKVYNILITQAGFYGISEADAKPRAEKYLKELGLWDKRDDVARNLSGGMKRRLMIARALIHEPRILILDEPTAGVDIELRRSMWAFLQKVNAEGVTIILTTHYLEEAESLCRNVAIIDRGIIVENTTVKSLLGRLQRETFVFDLASEAGHRPSVDGYELRWTDDSSFEVDVEKSQGLSKLFGEISKLNLDVSSMRNKANRLEELFISLTGESKQ
ncbi:ABC transporter ATP-binding protein [uncultured Umboniibacter sp.]|uniref:ABC transporter ATP-binding protein n=1 Tax=uncultured Umboniibacter sp. TaxID=1798917 RepID=UPI00262DC97D|nr:ABC transporter ATP-binding protein [uncultured Umboniibacter sp.]